MTEKSDRRWNIILITTLIIVITLPVWQYLLTGGRA